MILVTNILDITGTQEDLHFARYLPECGRRLDARRILSLGAGSCLSLNTNVPLSRDTLFNVNNFRSEISEIHSNTRFQ